MNLTTAIASRSSYYALPSSLFKKMLASDAIYAGDDKKTVGSNSKMLNNIGLVLIEPFSVADSFTLYFPLILSLTLLVDSYNVIILINPHTHTYTQTHDSQ